MGELRAKEKRKVTVDPNSLFVNIETIKRSMDEAAKVLGELAKEKECAGEVGALPASRALEQIKYIYSHLSKVLVKHFSAGAATTYLITKIAVTQQQKLQCNKE